MTEAQKKAHEAIDALAKDEVLIDPPTFARHLVEAHTALDLAVEFPGPGFTQRILFEAVEPERADAGIDGKYTLSEARDVIKRKLDLAVEEARNKVIIAYEEAITGENARHEKQIAAERERALREIVKSIDDLGPPSGQTNGECGDGSCCDAVFHHIREVIIRRSDALLQEKPGPPEKA